MVKINIDSIESLRNAADNLSKEYKTPKDNADYITEQDKCKGVIESLLAHGAKNAVTMGRLMQLSGINTDRAFYAEVAYERSKGALILAFKNAGYFLPSMNEDGQLTPEGYKECQSYCKTNRRTALSLFKNAEYVLQAIGDYVDETQIGIEGFEESI